MNHLAFDFRDPKNLFLVGAIFAISILLYSLISGKSYTHGYKIERKLQPVAYWVNVTLTLIISIFLLIYFFGLKSDNGGVGPKSLEAP